MIFNENNHSLGQKLEFTVARLSLFAGVYHLDA